MVVSEKISAKDQQEYWMGVGMLLYLVKHLHPELANMTRELSKANNDVYPAAYNNFLQMIKYVLDTKKLGVKIEPAGNAKEPWEIICFSINDYAGDPVSRTSITIFILYVLDVPVSWQSKVQKSVSLSSS